MKPTIYSLKSCDTCRKALGALAKAGVDVEVIDIRADGVAPRVLDAFAKDPGPDVLINRRSTTWRQLDEEAREKAMDPETMAGVLAEHPTLMKRPVIIVGETTLVGWTADIQKALNV